MERHFLGCFRDTSVQNNPKYSRVYTIYRNKHPEMGAYFLLSGRVRNRVRFLGNRAKYTIHGFEKPCNRVSLKSLYLQGFWGFLENSPILYYTVLVHRKDFING